MGNMANTALVGNRTNILYRVHRRTIRGGTGMSFMTFSARRSSKINREIYQ